MILLHENGYKALATTKVGDDLQTVMAELQGQIVQVGEGDLDATVGFSNRIGEIGNLGRKFNHMVQELRERREGVEHLHRAQMSRAECWPQSENSLPGGLTKSATCSQVLQE